MICSAPLCTLAVTQPAGPLPAVLLPLTVGTHHNGHGHMDLSSTLSTADSVGVRTPGPRALHPDRGWDPHRLRGGPQHERRCRHHAGSLRLPMPILPGYCATATSAPLKHLSPSPSMWLRRPQRCTQQPTRVPPAAGAAPPAPMVYTAAMPPAGSSTGLVRGILADGGPHHHPDADPRTGPSAGLPES